MIIVFALIMFNIMSSVATAATGSGVTQGEFVSRLIAAFRWGGGVVEPAEIDYLNILSGKRYIKFEAENYYNIKSDNVTLRTYNLYGKFSGTGWVSGLGVPTMAHFKINVPLEGEYVLIVAAKGDGQVWEIGNKSFIVNSGGTFREIEAGKIYLNAGSHELSVQIPQEGGIDYFIFNAPPLLPVEPLNGWKFDAPLRMHELAEVVAVILGLEESLQLDSKNYISVAELSPYSSSVVKTSADYLGTFYGKQWLRAGNKGATIELPVNILASGFYKLRLRILGGAIKVDFADKSQTFSGKPFFEWVDIGGFRLRKGTEVMHLELPPGGGVDVIEVIGNVATPAAYMAITGLTGDPEKLVKPAELDSVISSLSSRFKGRR